MIKEGIEINPDEVKPLGELAHKYADYYINDKQYPITIRATIKKSVKRNKGGVSL